MLETGLETLNVAVVSCTHVQTFIANLFAYIWYMSMFDLNVFHLYKLLKYIVWSNSLKLLHGNVGPFICHFEVISSSACV